MARQSKLSVIRFLRLSFFAIFIIIAFLYIPNVKVNNSTDRWFPESFFEVIEYKHFLSDFKSDAILIISFFDPGGFKDVKNSKWIDNFEKKLTQLSHVNGTLKWPMQGTKFKKKEDGHTQSLLVSFAPPSHLNPNRPDLLSKIQALLEDSPLDVHLAGTGVIHKALNDETKSSATIFLTSGLGFLLILLFVLLKKTTAIFSVLVISLGGVSSLLIGSSLLNIPMSIVMIILPVIVLFYGTSNALHILSHNGDMQNVFIPCLLTTFTSSIGFSVFILEPIPQLRDFAILANIGIWASFLFTLALFYPNNINFCLPNFTQNLIHQYPWKQNPPLLISIILIALFFFYGISFVKTELNSLTVLSSSNKAIKDHHFIEQNVGNYIPLEYTISIDNVKSSQIKKWIDEVFELPDIDGTFSFFDFPNFIKAEKNGYFNFEKKLGRATFFVPVMPTSQGILLLDKIDSISKISFEEAYPKVTGYVTLYGRIATELGQAFIKSLIYAFIAVFTILFIYLRNFKLFIASLIPNIFPIVVLLGLMGWLEISLDMITVPIGCLLLGIVVDDSLHFLFWFKKTNNTLLAIKDAGPGIMLTTFILSIGFILFLFSGSPPVKYFGLLSVSALIAAFIGDIILLPFFIKILIKDS